MTWTIKRAETWQSFVEFIGHFSTLTSPFITPYLFRGQANVEWKLESSLQRLLGGEATAAHAVVVEDYLLEEYLPQSHLFWADERPVHRDRLWEWWPLMQHYGVPTRLIDWTASAYVAAYFAVESHWDVDGAVWIMHPSSLKSVPTHLDADKTRKFVELLTHAGSSPDVYAFPAAQLSDRMAAQQGHFTLSANVLGDQESAIYDACIAPPWDEENAVKLVIPATIKPEFLIQLRSMNVTGRSLFPGPDGFGRSLAELTRLHGHHSREERDMFRSIRVSPDIF
jgi:hypothetical protein